MWGEPQRLLLKEKQIKAIFNKQVILSWTLMSWTDPFLNPTEAWMAARAPIRKPLADTHLVTRFDESECCLRCCMCRHDHISFSSRHLVFLKFQQTILLLLREGY